MKNLEKLTRKMEKMLFTFALALCLVGCNGKTSSSTGANSDDAVCTCPTPFVIYLQPFNKISKNDIENVKKALEKDLIEFCPETNYEYIVEVLPAEKLDDSFMSTNPNKKRYDAAKIVKHLQKSKNLPVIGLLTEDIELENYRDKKHWGILGFSFTGCKACVASTCRLKNNKQRDYPRLVEHEFIHAQFGYAHCPNDDQNCLMKDAKGHSNFSIRKKPCETCTKEIFKKWLSD